MVRPKRRRRWLLVTAVAFLLIIPLMLLGVAGAVTYRPSWYKPQSIDYARLEDDKRAQLQIENAISAALNQSEPVEIELSEARANRWIAAREELWPGEVPSLGPVHQPQVDLLEENRFRVGALVEQAGVEVVVSGTFHVDVQPDTVTMSWDHLNTGALRAPQKLVAEVVRKAAGKLEDRVSAAQIERAVADRRITLRNDFVWPNGKRRVRIVGLTIRDGTLRVSLAPK